MDLYEQVLQNEEPGKDRCPRCGSIFWVDKGGCSKCHDKTGESLEILRQKNNNRHQQKNNLFRYAAMAVIVLSALLVVVSR